MSSKKEHYNNLNAGGPLDEHSKNQLKTGWSMAGEDKLMQLAGLGEDKAARAMRRRKEKLEEQEQGCGRVEITRSSTLLLEEIEQEEIVAWIEAGLLEN